jgi:hypothetical protein
MSNGRIIGQTIVGRKQPAGAYAQHRPGSMTFKFHASYSRRKT